MSESRPYTAKRRASNAKWDEAHLDRLSLSFYKWLKVTVKTHAEAQGSTMNRYISEAIIEKLNREGK